MPVCGVLNVYKEKGCTSFHVVSELRKITGIKSIGHTGTLDPDAEGVLVVCLGKATKLSGMLTDTDKVYRAVMLLGMRTDTQDITGRVLEEVDMDALEKSPESEEVCEAVLSFLGTSEQVPPMYSALKVGGVKLVDAARRGENIERRPRKITVYGFENIKYNKPAHEISFEVSCSKGTYIRTLCEDIGKALGCPACLKSLTRTQAAGFCLEDALTLQQIKELAAAGSLEERIIPADAVLASLSFLAVKEEALKKLKNGNFLEPDDFQALLNGAVPGNAGNTTQPGRFRIYDSSGNFCAVYCRAEGSEIYKCEKMFI